MEWCKKEFEKWIASGSPTNYEVTSLCIRSCDLIDISCINNLPNLEYLDCSYNNIEDIQSLQLPNLKELNCSHNDIEDIQSLQLPNLEYLDCSYNKIVDIQGIQLPQLRQLYCNNNQIVDIQNLQLPNLEKIYCSGNNIVYIEGLQLPQLRQLYCSSNQIVDIQGLQLPNLETLYCSYNQITNLSFQNINTLQIVCCHNNPIEYIAPNVMRLLNRSKTKQNVYNDSQNVHNHNIQECIRTSIQKVISIQPIIQNLNDYILRDETLNETTKQILFEYMSDPTVHSTLQITFSELLLNVMSLIDTNENSNEIKKILNQEMNDSQCKCYTGRMSRLINCLNGYSSYVNVKISDAEQIGYVIQIVKEELEIKNEYTVEKHKELVKKELTERQYLETTINEWIDYIE